MVTKRWTDPAWRAGAERWIDETLTTHGLTRDGPVTYEHVRPWSVVSHLRCDGNRFWFKASATEVAYEPALLALLGTVAGQQLLTPIGLHPDRGWSLYPDGGRTLRDLVSAYPQDRLAHWEHALAQHARLQLATVPITEPLLRAGVPDMAPAVLPAHVERILATGQVPEPLRSRGHAWLPNLRRAAAELGHSVVPMTVQHDDLHDNNILVAEDGYRFVDWGDASIGHPFGVFLVVRRSIADQTGLDEHGPEIDALAQAYLEPFEQVAPRDVLQRDLALAEYVDGVARVESWRRALAEATLDEVTAYEDPVCAWLDELVCTPPP